MKTKLLFVCDENRCRSPTAEELFKGNKKYSAKSCGISKQAEQKINQDLVKWADQIFTMDKYQIFYILRHFKKDVKRNIINLDIYDYYDKNHPELIDLLTRKLKENKIKL